MTEIDKEQLYDLYVVQGLSIRDVAAKVGLSPNTVRRRLISFGIQTRDKNERDDSWQNREFLEPLYLREGKTTIEIAAMVSSTPSTVRTWLVKCGVPTRSPGGELKGKTMSDESRAKMSKAKKGKYTGENNPNWKGAEISDDVRERRSYVAKKWRETCLNRDQFRCQLCGATERLHVHHVLEYKDHPEQRWNVNNGITVCYRCHEKIHQRSFPDWLTGRKRYAEQYHQPVETVPQKKFDIGAEELERLYSSHSLREIAKLTGWSEEAVRKNMEKYGIERDRSAKARARWPSRDELKSVYERCGSMKRAAEELGLSETQVHKMIHEYGISIGSKGSRS